MKKLTLFVAALCMSAMSVMGAEVVAYTLTPAKGSSNAYADTCSVTIAEITWNIAGNSQQIPWRLGGKNLSKVDRAIYSKTVIADAITKIDVVNGGASEVTVNSLKLLVSAKSDFSEAEEIAGTFAASDTTTFVCPETSTWSNKYYKFVYNVTVTDTKKNKFVEFVGATFYKNVADVNATAVALDKTAATVEQYKSFTLTATPTPADAIDLFTWESDNTDVATVDATGKVTVLADNGTATITVTSKTTATVTATCVVTAKAAGILTCAQAVEIAKTVSANNEVAAGGKYVIRGYVTQVVYTYSEDYGTMTLWMADAAGADNLFEAYSVIPVAAADQAIKVGDFVEVVADITKYQKNEETDPVYETVKGGTIRLITAGPAIALENVEALEVYAENGRIYAAEGARIFTVSGIDVTEMNGQLNGIYIVKVGNQATKIAVK